MKNRRRFWFAGAGLLGLYLACFSFLLIVPAALALDTG